MIWFSSAYKGTTESRSAAKKPHKTKKSADRCEVCGFQHYWAKNIVFQQNESPKSNRGFCSALNDSAPLFHWFKLFVIAGGYGILPYGHLLCFSSRDTRANEAMFLFAFPSGEPVASDGRVCKQTSRCILRSKIRMRRASYS